MRKYTCFISPTGSTTTLSDVVSSGSSEVKWTNACYQSTFSMSLPTGHDTVGDHTVTVVRDTGCAGLVVKSTLVQDHQILLIRLVSYLLLFRIIKFLADIIFVS